jgi:hypothetical protein
MVMVGWGSYFSLPQVITELMGDVIEVVDKVQTTKPPLWAVPDEFTGGAHRSQLLFLLIPPAGL